MTATFHYGTALRYSMNPRIEIVGEVFGESDPDCTVRAELTAGWIYHLKESLALFSSIGKGIIHEGSELSLKLGLIRAIR